MRKVCNKKKIAYVISKVFKCFSIVTFSALDNEAEKATKPGYTHTANDDDDLDDLFDKQGKKIK